jgi:hypothetical protein
MDSKRIHPDEQKVKKRNKARGNSAKCDFFSLSSHLIFSCVFYGACGRVRDQKYGSARHFFSLTQPTYLWQPPCLWDRTEQDPTSPQRGHTQHATTTARCHCLGSGEEGCCRNSTIHSSTHALAPSFVHSSLTLTKGVVPCSHFPLLLSLSLHLRLPKWPLAYAQFSSPVSLSTRFTKWTGFQCSWHCSRARRRARWRSSRACFSADAVSTSPTSNARRSFLQSVAEVQQSHDR